jgi:hypothetical protein
MVIFKATSIFGGQKHDKYNITKIKFEPLKKNYKIYVGGRGERDLED